MTIYIYTPLGWVAINRVHVYSSNDGWQLTTTLHVFQNGEWQELQIGGQS